jgi:hypothetical protein
LYSYSAIPTVDDDKDDEGSEARMSAFAGMKPSTLRMNGLSVPIL